MRKVLFYNVFFMGLVALLAELIFGTWFSEAHALMKFTKVRDRQITQDNPIGGGRAQITYTRDTYGLRGLTGSVSEIDILTVGGSTTDQRWIDDSQTYQAVLRDLYLAEGKDVVIANAGIDGQSTFGHIANFSSWFDEIPDLKARYILYYVGINDLLTSRPNAIYDTVAVEDSSYNRLKATIKEKSVFYQLYRVFRVALADEHALSEINRVNIADQEPLTSEPMIQGPISDVLGESIEGFVDRVTELDRLTRDFGALPVFVTQRSARWTRRDGEILGISDYQPDFFENVRLRLPDAYQSLNGVDFYRMERALADALMARCMALGAICIDLMAELEFDLARDFYDPIHTTASGSRAIGAYLHRNLTAIGVP